MKGKSIHMMTLNLRSDCYRRGSETDVTQESRKGHTNIVYKLLSTHLPFEASIAQYKDLTVERRRHMHSRLRIDSTLDKYVYI